MKMPTGSRNKKANSMKAAQLNNPPPHYSEKPQRQAFFEPVFSRKIPPKNCTACSFSDFNSNQNHLNTTG